MIDVNIYLKNVFKLGSGAHCTGRNTHRDVIAWLVCTQKGLRRHVIESQNAKVYDDFKTMKNHFPANRI